MTKRLCTQDQVFLSDICRSPADDAPRLIYADWLQDRGDPRGEFIAVQVELARLEPDDPCRPALIERQRALLAQHEAAWRGTLPTFHLVGWGRFARGLVAEVVTNSLSTLERRATQIFATQPIEELQLLSRRTHGGERLRDLAPLPEPERWTSLGLTGHVLDMTWLDRATALRRLSTITISQSWATGDFLSALVREHQFGCLVSLRFRSCRNMSRSIRTMLREPGVARLQELEVSRRPESRAPDCLSEVAVAALIESPHLRDLRALNLEGQRFSRETKGRLRRRFPLVKFS
jgi:uncharacterized protein (TIGR02996 family)